MKGLTEKGFDYSIRIAELVRYLREEGKGFPLDEQLLSCGLEVGLICRRPPGKQDFARAMGFVREADYMIEMAAKAGYLTQEQTVYIRKDGRELLRLLEENG